MKRLVTYGLLLFLLSACATYHKKKMHGPKTEVSAQVFFKTYADRSDWEGFLSLYDEDMIFQDIILRKNLQGKEAFRAFYNWPDSLFSKHPDYPKTLVLEELVANDGAAVGKGYFTPFYYAGVLYEDWEHMRFTMILHFNEKGKITKHVDWVEYPPAFLKGIAERLLNSAKEPSK